MKVSGPGRILLADARLAPVAHAGREHRLQARLLAAVNVIAGVVGEVERLQLALQDVLRQRPAGDLARRGAVRSRGSASHVAWSVTCVEKFVSPVRKQKSTAVAGLAAMTCACVRTALSVALGACVISVDSQVSIVRNDFIVTAAICAAVAGSSAVP